MDGEITVDELQSLLDVESGAADDGTDGASPDADADDVNGDSDGDSALRVVDIRNPDAFARGHIPGSENIPAPDLTDRVEELDGADRVVTVCPHGKASVQAARLVGSYRGVDGPVESLAGGLEAWDGPLDADADAGPADDSPAPF